MTDDLVRARRSTPAKLRPVDGEFAAASAQNEVDSDWYVAQVADMAERLPDAYRAAINDAAEVIGRTRGLASIEANFERQ